MNKPMRLNETYEEIKTPACTTALKAGDRCSIMFVAVKGYLQSARLLE